MPSSALAR
uniref:Uncharacterized protein n=1 Tax=Arundo donax TaxID=35708 RepID=A0A0A9CN98_ARUDO